MTIHELVEYQTTRVAWPEPTPADRLLAQTLEDQRVIHIRWLRDDQAEITAYAWIGVLQFAHHSISITPKAAGGNLAVLQMLDYATNIDVLRHLPAQRTIATDGVHLRDLVCQLVTQSGGQLLRHGPARNYVTREQPLPAIRGRLLADRQIRIRYGQLDRLECRYDEFETDHVDNQLVAAGVDLAARTATAAHIRRHAGRVAGDFAALCDPASLPALDVVAASVEYGRHNEHYRAAHHWSLLLLRGGAFNNLYHPGAGRSSVFMIDMNTLFEDFVTRLVIETFTGTDIQVRPQARHRSLIRDETTGGPYGTVIPDLLLTRGVGPAAWRRVLDAKYKLYSDRRLDPSDVYQALLYAHTIGRSEPPTTVLIHPGAPGTARRLAIHNVDGERSARVMTIPLDIDKTLEALTGRQTRTNLLHQLRTEFAA